MKVANHQCQNGYDYRCIVSRSKENLMLGRIEPLSILVIWKEIGDLKTVKKKSHVRDRVIRRASQ